MSFFEKPILNSPYTIPSQHWELDSDGRPTDDIIEKRRGFALISATPKPQSVRQSNQSEMGLNATGLDGQDMAYSVTETVNEMRYQIDAWRNLRNPNDWQVSPVTQRLLQHWREIQKDETQAIRPFFCQLEAVETAIWLAEVAPKMGERGKRVKKRLDAAGATEKPRSLTRLNHPSSKCSQNFAYCIVLYKIQSIYRRTKACQVGASLHYHHAFS